MRRLLRLLKALADRNRLRIIMLLQHKQMCVCELTAVLGITQPSVSRHLKLLKDAGLVEDVRAGQWINYLPAGDSDDSLVPQILSLIRKRLEGDPQVAADRQLSEKADRMELACGGRDAVVA